MKIIILIVTVKIIHINYINSVYVCIIIGQDKTQLLHPTSSTTATSVSFHCHTTVFLTQVGIWQMIFGK